MDKQENKLIDVEVLDMKYSVGNIIVLCCGRTVYITSVDANEMKYTVVDVEDNTKIFTVNESEVYFLLT